MADDDDDVPAYRAYTSTGHYSTGFSASIKDGQFVEPVSALGPIGFITKSLSNAALKRLRKAQRSKHGRS